MSHHWAETASHFYYRFNTKCKVWVKVVPDFEILLRLMDGMSADAGSEKIWLQ
jgi:hypothetical protein